MKFAQILVKLWTLRIWVGVGVLLATVAAVASVTMVHSAVFASASTQMLVDSPQSALADSHQDLTGFTARAVVFARLMTTPEALQYIGKEAGIPGNLIAASGPVELDGPNANHTPTAMQDGRIVSPTSHYKLDFLQNPELPTVDVYAEAPTTEKAIALANGAVKGFAAYISGLEAQGGIPASQRVDVRQLGGATGGVVDSGASKTIAGMIFVVVLGLCCVLVLFVSNLREQLGAAKEDDARGVVSRRRPNYVRPVPGHDVRLPHSALMPEDEASLNPDMDGFVAEPSYAGNHGGPNEEELRRGVRFRR